MKNNFYFNLIRNNIDLSKYKLEANTLNQKIIHAYNIFYRENTYNIPLYGIDSAFEKWVKSGKSVITVPMRADEVIEAAIRAEYISPNAEGDTIDTLLTEYFTEITIQFLCMYNELELDLVGKN